MLYYTYRTKIYNNQKWEYDFRIFEHLSDALNDCETRENNHHVYYKKVGKKELKELLEEMWQE